MKKICIFTKYSENGPSAKYRVFNFKSELMKEFELTIYPFWNETYYKKYSPNKKRYIFEISIFYMINIIRRFFQIIFIAKNYDIVMFQKCVFPGIKINLLRYLKKNGCRLIFDVDDAIYMNKGDSSLLYVKHMDAVIVGNEELKKVYSNYSKNVIVIPTVEYSPAFNGLKHDTFENKIIIWIGSASSIDNLELIVKPINEFITEHKEVAFNFICDKPYGYDQKIINARFIKWDKMNALKNLSNGTIGIMPLKDNEFNRGKCGFKLIQYLNLEIPVIASDVGTNDKIVGNYGYIVHDNQEWKNAFEELLYNKKIYNSLKDNIRDSFDENYGFFKTYKKLRDALNGEVL